MQKITQQSNLPFHPADAPYQSLRTEKDIFLIHRSYQQSNIMFVAQLRMSDKNTLRDWSVFVGPYQPTLLHENKIDALLNYAEMITEYGAELPEYEAMELFTWLFMCGYAYKRIRG
jgi:hypothetical protein